MLSDPVRTDPVRWNWLAALTDTGWAVAYDVVPLQLARDLLAEAQQLHGEKMLTIAGVGRADDYQQDRSIRRDKIRWLNARSTPQAAYLDIMETVRLAVNRALFMGLFSYESHYAVYEPGAFYARHRDAFKGARNRVLSTVFYLNEDWKTGEGDLDDGGALAIFSDDEALVPIIMVPPEMGTLALFLSEDIPHEVLSARRDRYSIAGWFRVNDRLGAPSLQAPVLPGTLPL